MAQEREPMGRRLFLGGAAAAACAPWLRAGQVRKHIFVLMAGGPSQSDTFQIEEGPWTPASFRVTSLGGVRFPVGLMPKIGERFEHVALVRGIRAASTAHAIAQAALPGFPSLGTSGEVSLFGRGCVAEGGYACDFESACREARNLVRASRGDLKIGIILGGWDSHTDIYATSLNASDPNSTARRFDAGVGALIAGLAEDGLLRETTVTAMGEFGRRPGPLNAGGGRDHSRVHCALVAGGGITGGRAVLAEEIDGWPLQV